MNREKRPGEVREHSLKGSAMAFVFMWDLKQVRAQEQGRSFAQPTSACAVVPSQCKLCLPLHPGVKQDNEWEFCNESIPVSQFVSVVTSVSCHGYVMVKRIIYTFYLCGQILLHTVLMSCDPSVAFPSSIDRNSLSGMS